MTERSVTHSTFVVERTYDATPARVFAAWADPAAKRRWFAEGEGWEVETFDVDFRGCGHERSRFRYKGGPVICNDTDYQDIVPDRRIVIAYTLMVGERRVSTSQATVEFIPAGRASTRLSYPEQGAVLDEHDHGAIREQGVGTLLSALGMELRRQPPDA